MQIKNFIVVDDLEKAKRKGKCAFNGEVYIPIGTAIPVIHKGRGCIGIGVVHQLLISEDSTVVTFSLETNVSETSKRAYYDLYRNQNTMSESGDMYDNSDVVIPGAIGSVNASSRPRPNWSNRDYGDNSNRRNSSPSLGDMLDDDFGDDPYGKRHKRR